MSYDKYPETKINGFDKEVFKDKDAIKEQLKDLSENKKYCLTVECYPGVDDEILELIQDIYNPHTVIRSEDIFYDKDTLNENARWHWSPFRWEGRN